MVQNPERGASQLGRQRAGQLLQDLDVLLLALAIEDDDTAILRLRDERIAFGVVQSRDDILMPIGPQRDVGVEASHVRLTY
jgi:hypothetical protein